MHKGLIKAIEENTYQINPRVAKGFSTERIKQLEQFIYELFRITLPKFKCDFKLDNISMARPEEYFDEITRSRNNKKRNFEITRSDFYMVKLHCSLNGEPISTPDRGHNLLIPYSKGSNLLKIRGSNFMVKPVMADTAMSVMQNSLFIQVSCASLTFLRKDYSVLENNEVRTNHIIYGKQLHAQHRKAADGKIRQIIGELTVVHYVLATYGLEKAIKMFTGSEMLAGNIDTSELDREEWMVYESVFTRTAGKPLGFKVLGEFYEPHQFKIAIRKKDVTPLTESFVYSTMYIVDLFPTEVMAAGDTDFSDPDWWRILLGHIVHSTKIAYQNNIRKMNQHMDSILSYLDDITKYELQRGGIRVDNIIELFVWVCDNLTDKMREYNTGFDYSGKRLMVERYITSDLLKQINMLAWHIAGHVDKRGSITAKEAGDYLAKFIRPDIMMKITTGHGEVESIQTPTNNPIPKITSHICPQVNTGSKGKHNDINRDDPAYRLTPQLAIICSVRDLTKSVPTGHAKINLFTDLSEEGDIRVDPSLTKYINHISKVIGN